ncbi:peptide ABC transporter substrate-binding protein [Horticoccus sp. 23ND18S-11]|uniref:peptide ABC transporter substrate-binding protein n=1 Tax=Horticoccus sp. 23ND18S-11 TaxID=3391832 RepID=UPI0039C98D52
MRTFVPATVGLALSWLVLGAGCSRHQRPVDEGIQTRTLLVGNAAEPATLDPHLLNAYSDMRVAIALFEGLTVLDEKTAQPLPGVARRWDVSPDGLTYTFHLRPEAKWSNGERVTAGDFVFSFRRILTPALGSVYAYMLWPIKNAEALNTGKLTDAGALGVQALDDATLQITLERPTPYVLALAAHNTWFPVPRKTVEQFGRIDARENPWTRPLNIVSNGAFTLAEWRPNARIVVAKNPRYWGAAQNQLERVIFFPIEKADAEELSFRAGQLHITYGVPASKLATYRQQSPDRLRQDPLLSSVYLNFNVTKPPLDNPKVRRALALAVDRKAIAERIYQSSRLPGPTLVPQGCAGYTPPAGQPEDYVAARALLAEAGFPEGRGLPTIPLQVGNDDKTPKVVEILQALWQRELGVKITIEMLEQKTLMQNQQTLAYSIGFMGWVADYPDPTTFLEIFQTGNGNNWTGWGSREYDALLQEAARTLDVAQRLRLLQRAETILLQEAPLATLMYGASTYLIHPAVKHWQASPLGLNRYQVVELKH